MTDESNPKAQLMCLQRSPLTKPQLEHQYKLSLMRDCQIFGKSLIESRKYFNSKGYSLSKSLATKLKKELKSTKLILGWFSKEALYVIEEDHMLSVERIRSMEDKLVNDFWEANNVEIRLKTMAQFESIQMTKTKMFSYTPMVQEMLEAHRRQEDMENKTAEPEKTEERI